MKMNELESRQQQIIDEFSVFTDWMDKYEYLIELGKELEPLSDSDKTEQNLIKGCQSQVWLTANYADGLVTFRADSDAIITKGIIGLLIKVLSGLSPKEIIDADLHFIDAIGLRENLSPTRSNGLVSMIKQIKMYAVAFAAES
ncbi:MAG: SufE family protein [Salinivirgaceae bacterium]|nr:SufE family protein [Salinivirgaceae bacterium]MBO7495551.1 SufE family protein [Salinivirgaceae bacterium]